MRSDLIPLPLGKIRVVDATHVVAGPFCSMLLGDAGAEVIKVERPGGEKGRRTPPMITDDSGQGVSSRYLTVNRNKKSITLDLRQPRGKALFEYLVGVSDVVLDNWGPGAMKRLGLDYSRLNAINPSIVYATITGYGDSDALRGPYSGWAANNSSAQAMAGWMEITGQPDRPPQMVGDAIGDTVPGIWTAYGILLALMSRETTGLGQHVDMAMYDCMLAHVTGTVASYQVTGIPPGRNREAMGHPQLSLQALDGYVVLAGAAEEEKWAALWTLIGREDFARDPNYLGRDGTGAFFVNVLQPELEKWTRAIPKRDLTRQLLNLGFSASMVQNAEEVMGCLQLEARHMWWEFDHPIAGRFYTPGSPVKMSLISDRTPGRPPTPGEHNEEVLGGLLGLSHSEMEKAKEEGAI